MRIRRISVIDRGTKPVNNADYIGGLSLSIDYTSTKEILADVFGIDNDRQPHRTTTASGGDTVLTPTVSSSGSLTLCKLQREAAKTGHSQSESVASDRELIRKRCSGSGYPFKAVCGAVAPLL